MSFFNIKNTTRFILVSILLLFVHIALGFNQQEPYLNYDYYYNQIYNLNQKIDSDSLSLLDRVTIKLEQLSWHKIPSSYWKFVLLFLSTTTLVALSNSLLKLSDSEDTDSRSSLSSSSTSAIKPLSRRHRIRNKLSNISSAIMDGLSYTGSKLNGHGFSSNSQNFRDPEYKKSYNVAVKSGAIGGLVNDGNTCFMNSVLQSLASSNEFMEFLASYTNNIIPGTGGEKSSYTSLSTIDDKIDKNDDLKFSKTLMRLLTKINGSHFNRSGYYKTNQLMKAMPSGANKNLMMGYDQEDAQEFYQLVLEEIEKEFKKTLPGIKQNGLGAKKSASPPPSSLFVEKSDDMIYGSERLGEIGEVYVPANQIDPNYPSPENKVYPLKLITPVDGLSAERIGCLACGEVGGIRYSVISGLSLNLQANQKFSYSLYDLLDDWIQPEIIDDVECNRCGLLQIAKKLEEQIDGSKNEKLTAMMKERVKEIKSELSKPIISDEVYEKLHTKNNIQKSRKIKQIFYSRPPPLLVLHINRSVFDPKTYMIRKNNAQVHFPLKLDLTNYVAECDDINMDARLDFRKQDELKRQQNGNNDIERIIDRIPGNLNLDEISNDETSELIHRKPRQDALGNDIEEDDDEEEEEAQSRNSNFQQQEQQQQQQPSPPQSIDSDNLLETQVGALTYSLKAAISHFGTHNYGHYIAFRKYRGIWWRVSDETVRVATEREVLNSSGTFMLFYELSSRNDPKDGIKEEYLEDDVENSDNETANGSTEVEQEAEDEDAEEEQDEEKTEYNDDDDDEDEISDEEDEVDEENSPIYQVNTNMASDKEENESENSTFRDETKENLTNGSFNDVHSNL
ncbi:hypothetical protein PACTADRAFT_4653 [Pachysolen tannophilus NRRL Y-2460]|uniref:ubiquitinyl hydrolase 1 n=1 Tax=Pachysolen tannophilus NRRL Y-2460 TaxID=669874 RepID=A0A1E4TPS2_PACTA|nr:hypothetical protein PACTADRAFT_4653 [Pachysolen tannophilus NRRL Y-2460]